MGKGNNIVPNGHFHKNWQGLVKTWFNQPARKYRLQQNRVLKAKSIAPIPAAGLLRPMVHCPTIRYNTKIHAGRGFTLEELKLAGLTPRFARTIGIAVDHRRRDKSMESMQANAHRLKLYKSRLILFPLNNKKLLAGEATEEQQELATQIKSDILPLVKPVNRCKAKVPTALEKKFSVFVALRKARADEKLLGIRANRIKTEEV